MYYCLIRYNDKSLFLSNTFIANRTIFNWRLDMIESISIFKSNVDLNIDRSKYITLEQLQELK